MIGSKLRMSEICKGIIMMVLTFCMLFSEPLQYKADGSTEYEKRLRVAFYPLEGFFEYDDEGNEIGYGVDLLNEISKYTGIQFDYVYAESWEITKQMLLDGEADIRMPGTLPSSPSVTLEYSNSSIIDTYYSVMTLNSREDLYYEDYDTFKTLKVEISQNLYNNISAMEDFKKINIGEEQIKLYEGYNECR